MRIALCNIHKISDESPESKPEKFGLEESDKDINVSRLSACALS